MGLENLGEFYKTSGLAPGYVQAVKGGADLNAVLSQTAHREAETDRYRQETPLSVQGKQLQNEQSRLGNLEGQAKEKHGVQDAQAQQQALEAQQKFESLPEEHKMKMITAIQQKTNAALEAIKQNIMSTGDVPGSFALLEQEYPQLLKDGSYNMMKGQYLKTDPKTAIDSIKLYQANLASSQAYGSSEQQGRMISEEQKFGHAKELQKLQNEGTLAAANTRAAAGGSLSMAELTDKWLKIYHDNTLPPEVREQARQTLEYLRNQGVTEKSSLIGPQTTTKSSLPPVGGAPAPAASNVIKLD